MKKHIDIMFQTVLFMARDSGLISQQDLKELVVEFSNRQKMHELAFTKEIIEKHVAPETKSRVELQGVNDKSQY